jgi:hypothetical protein
MARVGDRDRDLTASVLQRHYVEGRLSAEELSERLDEVMHARTRAELVLAARSLPVRASLGEIVGPPARAAGRVALLVALTALWWIASFVLLLTFAVTVIVHGATTGVLIGFPAVWALGTWLLWRAWRSARAR